MDLPIDDNGKSVQTLYPESPVNGTSSGVSARLVIPAESNIIRVAAGANVYIALGDSSVTASSSDIFFPAGVEIFKVPNSATHIAFIQEGASAGVFSICRMK